MFERQRDIQEENKSLKTVLQDCELIHVTTSLFERRYLSSSVSLRCSVSSQPSVYKVAHIGTLRETYTNIPTLVLPMLRPKVRAPAE